MSASAVRPVLQPGSARNDHGLEPVGRLVRDLVRVVRGEVRFDEPSRRLYANDASIYRMMPIGVVIPRDDDDVIAALAACRRHRMPVMARGGGTGLSGQSVNASVVFDFSKYMNRILELDPVARTARVQPGVICDQLRDAALEHGLTFAPDPATHDHNTLGGMLGNNSCGTHSVYGGKTVDNTIELDVLLYDGTRMSVGIDEEEQLDSIIAQGGRRGEVYAGLRFLRETYGELIRQRYPKIPRRVSGYNLDDLLPEKGFNTARALVGSESTCVLILSATVRLLPWPAHRALVALGYPDSPAAAAHVTEILETGPLAVEFFEYGIIENLRKKNFGSPGMDELPQGRTFVLVEYGGGSQADAEAAAAALGSRLRALPAGPDSRTYTECGAAGRYLGGAARSHRFHPDTPGTWRTRRLGGRRRRPFPALRLSARLRGTGPEIRLPHRVVRALWPGLHPQPAGPGHQDSRGHCHLCRLPVGCGGPGGGLGRVLLG